MIKKIHIENPFIESPLEINIKINDMDLLFKPNLFDINKVKKFIIESFDVNFNYNKVIENVAKMLKNGYKINEIKRKIIINVDYDICFKKSNPLLIHDGIYISYDAIIENQHITVKNSDDMILKWKSINYRKDLNELGIEIKNQIINIKYL